MGISLVTLRSRRKTTWSEKKYVSLAAQSQTKEKFVKSFSTRNDLQNAENDDERICFRGAFS